MTSERPVLSIVGPYPPPYGGISVHIERLLPRLLNRGIKARVFDEGEHGLQPKAGGVFPVRSKWLWFPWFFLRRRREIVHCHSGGWKVVVLAGVSAALGTPVVLTFHGVMLLDHLRRGSRLKRWLLSWAIRRVPTLISTSMSLAEDLAKELDLELERFHVISAYIPPIRPARQRDVPLPVGSFVKSHQPLLLSAVWIRLLDGVDLYGVDMLIDLVEGLKRVGYERLGLIAALSGVLDRSYFDSIQERVSKAGLESSIRFDPLTSDEFSTVLESADLFLRATITDTDPLSVREAMASGIPVVASDAVPRPKGVHLFSSRNASSLQATAEEVLRQVQGDQALKPGDDGEENAGRIIGLYEDLWRESR